MKIKPILFGTPMVQSLLDGNKGMTRRLLPDWQEPGILDSGKWMAMANRHRRWGFGAFGDTEIDCIKELQSLAGGSCPYGTKRDLLWVREGFRCNGWATDVATIFYKANEHDSYTEMCEQYPVEGKKRLKVSSTWKPSIHMPRWASRLTLEITGVKIERLNDISEADAKAEGITMVPFYPDDGYPLSQGFMFGRNDDKAPLETCAKNAFISLWESINGDASWDDNPWVWVVEFNVHRINVDVYLNRLENGNG